MQPPRSVEILDLNITEKRCGRSWCAFTKYCKEQDTVYAVRLPNLLSEECVT